MPLQPWLRCFLLPYMICTPSTTVCFSEDKNGPDNPLQREVVVGYSGFSHYCSSSVSYCFYYKILQNINIKPYLKNILKICLKTFFYNFIIFINFMYSQIVSKF